jgi:hypothetical protein
LALALYADDHIASISTSLPLVTYNERAPLYAHLGMGLDEGKDKITKTSVGQVFLGMKATDVNGKVRPVFDREKAFNSLSKHTSRRMDLSSKLNRVVSIAYLLAFDDEACDILLQYHRFLRNKYPNVDSPTLTKRELQSLWLGLDGGGRREIQHTLQYGNAKDENGPQGGQTVTSRVQSAGG